MATIVLSAAGAALGASVGGGVLGLSSVAIGRAVGATVGRVIDQQVLGEGSRAVETGRVDRFRLTGASEGAPIAELHGRMRVAGQVIWSSRFLETVTTSSGSGKGTRRSASTTSYSYSVSLAVALCRGEITHVGRIWADGIEIAPSSLTLRVYKGSDTQLPDPKIEAVEGAGNAPAYRGTAYVVIEDLELGRFGNRVPQLSFEVMRPKQPGPDDHKDMARGIRGVALIPGTGEYALATTPVHFEEAPGLNRSANVNSPSGVTDFVTSFSSLEGELPNCGSVSLVVSWFGSDLRAGECRVRPKVEQTALDGVGMPWHVSGLGRSAATAVVSQDGRPIYGGTPTDQSVVQAIKHMNAAGKKVMFYPFILMEQLAGNGLTNPWDGAGDQPALPWRGRITTSLAPGQAGTTDRTAAAEAEVTDFFGTASSAEFAPDVDKVGYTGADDWRYRRFILHYAHLCALAGGVDAFCIGSEMRSLTQIRGAGDSFPAVAALRTLAADVRAILGPETKIGYAADWSEYFGYQPQDGSGDVYFHLDPLWSDPEIDFIGIDNYMPLSDWRDGTDHADADWGSIYNLGYLKANIAGGEGYDWYYASENARAAQIRSPIEDGAYGEPWVFRYKDLKSWWSEEHYERSGGVRASTPTGWLPESKPIWFTELGCAAIDKGTNQPNKFLDPKSSESALPRFSSGRRDEVIQMQYLRGMFDFYHVTAENPVSDIYFGPMIDMERAHVWAWDARPYPHFPGNLDLWSDGENYARGHWVNGRTSALLLADLVEAVCEESGVTNYDTSDVFGAVRGYLVSDTETGRAALQPLMLAYGFDAVERDGAIQFRTRDGSEDGAVASEALAALTALPEGLELGRAPEAEIAGHLRLSFAEADGDYETRSTEAIFPDEATRGVASSDLPLALTRAEAWAVAERWLAESRIARDRARLALPLSRLSLGAGDVVTLSTDEGDARYRIDRAEQTEGQVLEAVRLESEIYLPSDATEEFTPPRAFVPAVPVFPVFLDLPLLSGDEVPHAPHLAVTATPWPGSVAVYSSPSSDGYLLDQILPTASVIGRTLTELPAAAPGRYDRGAALRVEVYGGTLESVSAEQMLNGANLAAIGDGLGDTWEVIQFADAELVAPGTYDLSLRLRGQAGSDGVQPALWSAGSVFVLLNESLEQIGLEASARGLARYYRIGPAERGFDDPAYIETQRAFDGIGLRPYGPAHLRARPDGAGGYHLSWVRRTRVDGDNWASVEVPLGEESESYQVEILVGSTLLRSDTTSVPSFDYSAAMMAADGVTSAFSVRVAQISTAFGPGPFTRIGINE